MGQWVGPGRIIKNQINVNGWVNGWDQVKSLKNYQINVDTNQDNSNSV